MSGVSRFLWLFIVAIVTVHAVFGAEENPLTQRVLLAVPAVLLAIEARSFMTSEARELPFIVLALLQYYVAFGFPVFFDLPFFDVTGPVFFSQSTRVAGGMAVALGAVSVWAGAKLGLRFGRELQPFALKVLPPDKVPTRWDDAFYIFAGTTVAMTMLLTFAPGAIPSQTGIAVGTIFALEFALGLATVRPPRRLGSRASQALLAIGMAIGVLRGQIDPIARIGTAFVAAQWVATRRVALGFICFMVALFLVLQPAKKGYREQVWGRTVRTGEQVGLVDRVDAWQNALTAYFSSDTKRKTEDGSAVSRLSELEPVLHAIDVVPSRIDYAYGESFQEIVYAPIPRLIWANKPTTLQQATQRYAVIFGRQSERGADTTAIGMSLLVEGYWNFGWFGVGLVCTAMGLLMGMWQRLFAGDHWALRGIGVVQIATVQMGSTAVSMLSSLFQLTVGRLLAAWFVFWLAQLLSDKVQHKRQSLHPARVGREERTERG